MSALRFPANLGYHGLRMTADEFLALGETQERYELIDGVVVMSPSPFFEHNEIAYEVGRQIGNFAHDHRTIRIAGETDVRLSATKVYRPDICVFRIDRLKRGVRYPSIPPDLVVEVLSEGTQAFDLITKRADYEKFGVGEYWVVDPNTAKVRVWRRQSLKLVEADVKRSRSIPCKSIPGLSLDLAALKRIANPD